jgi:hypothetical protein
MANPNTAAQTAATSVVDQAVRIAADNSRRSTESAQAALQAGRKYFEHVAEVNRDLFSLYTAGLDAGLETFVDYQNAALANTAVLFDTSANLTKDAFRRYTDLARQAQATTVKTYQGNAKLFDSFTSAAA